MTLESLESNSLSIPGAVQMHDGQESELKFFFEPRDLSKIKALPLLKDALPQANYQRLVSTYFDTPNKYLWKHGVSLRVRQNEQGLVQTLKQQKSSALDRGEWEAKVNRNLPDIDALKKTPLASFFKKRRVRERLQGKFRCRGGAPLHYPRHRRVSTRSRS